MKLKRGHRSPVPAFLLTFWLIAISFPGFALRLWAVEVDLKPGDTIGPHNWQRVQGMVGENLLNRIKQGYTLKIKESKNFKRQRSI
jgi:hypothetical protein